MLFSYFPPSFVLIFAREPIAATSITQAPFRFFTSVTTKCIAVRHPCFDFTTEGGKRIFNTNEKQTPNTTRDNGARRLLCKPQATAIHRAATSRTAHKVERPPVSERRYEGGNLHLTDQTTRSERSTTNATTRHQTSARRSQVVSLVS